MTPTAALPKAFARTACLAAVALAACGGTAVRPSEPASVRRTLSAELAALPADAPLTLRFNPAPCECPPFEIRLGTTWVRAEVDTTDLERASEWLAWLRAQPDEQLPIEIRATGKADRDLLRTTQGSYAVRIELAAVESPSLPAPPSPPAEPPADGPAAAEPAPPAPTPPGNPSNP